ncbi:MULTISPECIES: tRNA (guanosine(46)-N7)-methyltransferase TrmB [unclassified Butyrivibrio]|uniref:tRNA (guanosine(46)-N7)-methyltransferase TrmB n=1 Tax=unclassified Butyrivibrio TaxID=2639466 RepID=UPI00040E5E8A|nr:MULTISPECIES: tRNA (guanosine(46)-N7)-methyltransferase TrmB [unclassified Butyrivibrio]
MRLRNIAGSRERIAESPFTIDNPEQNKGKWKEVFGNDNPIRIEVGTGKGRFIMDLAAVNPDINYVGIEKYSSVLLRAVQKQTELELTNVRFIRMEAEIITEVFEEGEVDRIYLNFSDPWPKERHAQRRLTSSSFLRRYDQILKKDGQLEFKTDNRELFDFSLMELNTAGWHAEAVTYDLHNDASMNEGNIMTEYEEKFSAKGNPIFKYIIKR